ncbi:MAG: M28 family metallopeptidase [Gemmatimonadetes bacterium]|nr:M28 family metallopeptidase [Gemmatimonadota bacterium]
MAIPAARACALLALFAFIGCAPPPVATDDITARYTEPAGQVIAAALADSAAYDRLGELVDRFGHRFSGSESLERALDWILAEMQGDGLENVRGEPVMVPRWVRGDESVMLVRPRPMELSMLGLGGSVATPPEGIEAEVLVVRSFEELEARAADARGRIVLFDVAFTSYGETVAYRRDGAIAAARAGAVASLIRSVASASMRSPHTGSMRYEEGVARIPHAALSVEDATMLGRMKDRGERIVVRVTMNARTLPDAESRNVIAELTGSERPDEVVVMGGHIDSWDVGQGAMDDGGGSVAAWEALRILHELGLRPRRTIRVVLWTNEENGLRGGNAYRDAHAAELDHHVLAIESDAGVFQPRGFGFTGSDAAFDIVQRVGRLLEPIGADSITRGGGGADIGPIMERGVPGMGLQVDGTRYFWYHHSDADTLDKLDPVELARCVAALAIMAYVVADLPEPLPREARAQ